MYTSNTNTTTPHAYITKLLGVAEEEEDDDDDDNNDDDEFLPRCTLSPLDLRVVLFVLPRSRLPGEFLALRVLPLLLTGSLGSFDDCKCSVHIVAHNSLACLISFLPLDTIVPLNMVYLQNLNSTVEINSHPFHLLPPLMSTYGWTIHRSSTVK